MGGWRTGHDFPMDETDLPLIKRLEEKRFQILINKSLNALFVCIVSAQVYECSARVPLENIFFFLSVRPNYCSQAFKYNASMQ